MEWRDETFTIRTAMVGNVGQVREGLENFSQLEIPSRSRDIEKNRLYKT